MMSVDVIGDIRRAYFEQRLPIKEIVRTLRVSRATVRKTFRATRPRSSMSAACIGAEAGAWVEVLAQILEKEAKLPRRKRRSTQRRFEELRGRGYDGAHDSVHRFPESWRDQQARTPAHAFVPLALRPAKPTRSTGATSHHAAGFAAGHQGGDMKLSHSRMPFVRAYFGETQEVVFEAHNKASVLRRHLSARHLRQHEDCGGSDFVGKARQYNRRFLQMCSHHLVEPVACTPASGWEKDSRKPGRQTARSAVPAKPRYRAWPS